MPQIIPIDRSALRDEMPQAQYGGRRASPLDFGAGLGDEITQFGDTAAKAVKIYAADQARLENFGNETKFLDLSSEEATRLETEKRDAKGGGPGFTQDFMKAHQQKRDEFLATVPVGQRPVWEARFAKLDAQLSTTALGYEFSLRDDFYKANTGDGLSKLATGIDTNPSGFADYKKQGHQLIDSSGMSASDKEAAHLQWDGMSDKALAISALRTNPTGVMAILSGQTGQLPADVTDHFMTVLRAKESGNDDGATPGIPGQTASGRFQLTDGWWKTVLTMPGAKEAGLTANGKNDPVQQTAAMKLMMPHYIEVAKAAGAPVTEQTLYMVHFMGDAGFAAMWRDYKKGGHGNAAAMFPAAAKVNPSVFYKKDADGNRTVPRTVAEVFANQTKTFDDHVLMTDAAAPAQGLAGGPKGPVKTPELPPATGLREKGNLDPWHRKVYQHPGDNGYGTTNSISIGTDKGETLIPTIIDGKQLTEEQAIEHYRQTGENFGTFDTPEHADAYATELHNRQAAFVEAGGYPEGGTPQGLAGGQPATPQDPNSLAAVLGRLPVDARQSLFEAGNRQLTQERQQAAAADQAAQAAKRNQLELDLGDGKAGQADIDKARADGWLTDFDDVNRANTILTQRQKKNDDLTYYNTAVGTPGFTWNPFDPKQRDAVDAAVKAQGGTPQAAFDVFKKTGILPSTAVQSLRGGLLSNDPQRVTAAATMASNIMAQNPHAFAGVEGGDQLEKAGLLFSHFTQDLGFDSVEAGRRVQQMMDPKYKPKIAVDDPGYLALKKDVTSGRDLSRIVDTSGRAIFQQVQVDPAARAAVLGVYSELALQHYQEFGDADAAKAYALKQTARIFGISNGRLQAYPPERVYPAVNGNFNYIYEQAAGDVAALTGKKIPREDIQLVPIPTVTGQAWRAGQPTPYMITYTEVIDGQRVHRTLPGHAFVADPGKAGEAVSAANKAKYDAARKAKKEYEDGSNVGFTGF